MVTVDEADGDPVRLAGHVALALHRIQPLDAAVFRALAVGDGSRHLTALGHLLTSLRSWDRPVVLVLDDVHELRNVAAMNFIRALAAGLPAGFQLAVGSRLMLGFGRLRSEDRCGAVCGSGVEGEARAIRAQPVSTPRTTPSAHSFGTQRGRPALPRRPGIRTASEAAVAATG